jgi:hypothetical protein
LSKTAINRVSTWSKNHTDKIELRGDEILPENEIKIINKPRFYIDAAE